MQKLINHLEDYLTGSDYRRSGHSLYSVINNCRLIFDKVDVGSFRAVLGLQDKQTVLSGYETLGEESILEFYNIIHDFTSDVNLEIIILDKIKHPLHRARIVEDIYKIWPHEYSKYKIRLKTPEGTQIELKPNYKLLIHSLISEESRKNVSTKGVLSMIQVAPTKQKLIRIIGPFIHFFVIKKIPTITNIRENKILHNSMFSF